MRCFQNAKLAAVRWAAVLERWGKLPVSKASVQRSLNFPMKCNVNNYKGWVDHKWRNNLQSAPLKRHKLCFEPLGMAFTSRCALACTSASAAVCRSCIEWSYRSSAGRWRHIRMTACPPGYQQVLRCDSNTCGSVSVEAWGTVAHAEDVGSTKLQAAKASAGHAAFVFLPLKPTQIAPTSQQSALRWFLPQM